MYDYMQVISDLAGPDAFNKGLKAMRPDYFPLITPWRTWVTSKVYDEFYAKALDHWFPMRVGGPLSIKPGSAHTWMHT